MSGPGNETFSQNVRAYQLRGQTPLGAGELTADLSESDNGVDVDNNASPYDVSHIDHRYNAGLAWQRSFATSQFSVGGYTRYESLNIEAPGSQGGGAITASQAQPLLGQTIDVAYIRGGLQPSAKLRFDGGLFESEYTSFGANLDGRFGAIYNADPKTTVRFSLGTGFCAPLLLERDELPYNQLALDGNNVFVAQGNPNEHPEHATEYEFGMSREFMSTSTLDVSIYQTALRDPIEIFYPLAAVGAGMCARNSYTAPIPACVSFTSNVGNAVYQGAEMRFLHQFQPQHLFLNAMYGLNVAYPKNLNAQFSNPTSGGSLVDGAQFPGIPQQQGSLRVDWSGVGTHASAGAVFRGNNNELNQPPFALVNALIGERLGSHLDLSLAGTNVFNGAAGSFTEFGGGVPYRGLIGSNSSSAPLYGPLPTNALYIEPMSFRLILSAKE